jgi:N-acetylmuramoyl-L-alanine amidase
MATDYQVQRGDCIGSIAYTYNLPWQKIWNHPKNSELKKQRQDPNVLREGDSVHIPDIEPGGVSAPTDARHRFVVKRRVTKLRLRVVVDPGPKPVPEPPPRPPSPDPRNVTEEDPPPDTAARADEPRKSMAYTLVIESVTIRGQTDSDGFLECDIPSDAMSGRLVLAPDTPHETEVALNLGYLDPIDEVSGVKQRLRNLCFDSGDETNEETSDLEDAVRAFQSKHGLSATGTIDDATRAALLKAHIS